MSETLIHLPVDEILIRPDRQRQNFDKEALLDLAQKIMDHGLLHPPGIDNLNDKALVYGERRLKVLKALAQKKKQVMFNGQLLPVGVIPVVNCNTDDPVKLEEIELSENAARQDLTWQENTRAIKRIEEMLLARKRREVRETQPDLPEIELPVHIPVKEIAAVAKTSLSAVYEAIDVAEHLDDPDVAKAKTKKEAQKIIAKKRTAEHRAKVADAFQVSDKDHQIIQGDCREVIKTLPSDTFTSIVTDPPYGIDMHKDQSWDGGWHEYDDTEAYCFNLINALLPEWDRTSKDEAHLYMFCDFAKFEKLRAIVEGYRISFEGDRVLIPMDAMLDFQLGRENLDWIDEYESSLPVFEVMYFPFIWDKGNVASYPRPEHWPRKSYECILYGIKGKHKQSGLDLAVINVPQLQNQEHPAGKPLELYQRLVLRSTNVGDSVLDCFAGQGNLLKACRQERRQSVSIELSDTYYPLLVEAYNETNS